MKDYKTYADKEITPAMGAFSQWLTDVTGYAVDARSVALAGTLRADFQRSDFWRNHEANYAANADANREAKAQARVDAAKAAAQKAQERVTNAEAAAKDAKAKAAKAAKATVKAKDATA